MRSRDDEVTRVTSTAGTPRVGDIRCSVGVPGRSYSIPSASIVHRPPFINAY